MKSGWHVFTINKYQCTFNCLFARSKAANSELLTIQLMKSYCLPFVLYASESVPLSSTNIRTLDNCVNRAVYRIFGMRDGENMACLRDSLGLPSLKGMVEGRRIKFLDKLLVCDGPTVIVQTYVNNLAFS